MWTKNVGWLIAKSIELSMTIRKEFSDEFMFMVGFTLSFHIFMTVEVMKKEQPDIIKSGNLFSIIFIYLANVFIVLLVLSFIFDLSFISFTKEAFVLSKEIYINIFNKVLS